MSPCCSYSYRSHHGSAIGTGTSTPSRPLSLSAPSASASSRIHSPDGQRLRIRNLNKALHYLTQAETEARAYFEPSSRRITRASLRRLEVFEMLGSNTPTNSSSQASPELAGLGNDHIGIEHLELSCNIDLNTTANVGAQLGNSQSEDDSVGRVHLLPHTNRLSQFYSLRIQGRTQAYRLRAMTSTSSLFRRFGSNDLNFSMK